MKNTQELLLIIKSAMLGELNSATLYEEAAERTEDEEIRNFCIARRDEEQLHYHYLLQYYHDISEKKEIKDSILQQPSSRETIPIFSRDFVKRIGENKYLFSAISTALVLEKDAFEFYRKSAQETDNLALEAFFYVIALWETKHYDDLLVIQKEAEQYFWHLNQFEPF